MKKYFLLLLVLVLSIFMKSNIYAESKIVYIDLQKIMKVSKAGKNISSQLEKIHKTNIANFKKTEDRLKKDEEKIVSQKNVLSKDDFQKALNKLRVEANNYRKSRNENINSLTKKRIEATAKLINMINPLLAKYSDENAISIIIQKKNIIIGKSELDITDKILKLVDKEIKTFKLN